MSLEYNILEAFGAVTREKNVDQETVMESLVIGLQSAAKKRVGLNADIQVDIDPESGEIEIAQRKRVVEKVVDPESEISEEKAVEEFGDEVGIGDIVKTYLDIQEFGRNAIGVAKQVLMQKVRDAERSHIFEQFRDRVGEVVVGNVQQVDRGNILVSLGRVEALLPFRERIRGENFHQGKPIKAFIIEVQNSSRGPQVILSRTHAGFLKSLFEAEVPEIEEKIVEIRAVAREPGTRSKIAVLSHDERVDAVGSCVGMKGSRVQAVTRELAGEKIDIVPWSDDEVSLLTRALSPARVNQVIMDKDTGQVTAIIDDDQLSLAIGREGKNVRLAAKLTNFRIDLVSTSDWHLRQRLEEELAMDVGDLSNLLPGQSDALKGIGINTVEELSHATEEQLVEFAGIDVDDVPVIIATAQATMEELRKQVEQMIEEEKARQASTDFGEAFAAEDEQKLSEKELFTAESTAAAPAKEPDSPKLKEEDLFKGEGGD